MPSLLSRHASTPDHAMARHTKEDSTAKESSTADRQSQPSSDSVERGDNAATRHNSLAEAQRVVSRLEGARAKAEACSLLSLTGSEDLQVGPVTEAGRFLHYIYVPPNPDHDIPVIED